MHRFLWLLLLPLPLQAQLLETFSDGNFTENPPWLGTTAYWTIDTLASNPRLRTNGPPRADTLFLATPSTVSWGLWQFTISYEQVNLSNFNGVRIYLMADTADLKGPVHGYFLQLGTNNSDEVRLYRQDGDPATRRILLGRSDPILTEPTQTLTLKVLRTETGHWSVSLEGQLLLEASDATYWKSRYFGLWVKHTTTTGRSYTFDDLLVAGEAERPDRTPPEVTGAVYRQRLRAFLVDFSEPIDTTRTPSDAFYVEAPTFSGIPDNVRWDASGQTARLHYARIPPSGSYRLYVRGLRDPAGNLMRDTVLALPVVTDTLPPRLVDLYPIDSRKLGVRFDEPATGCDPAAYRLLEGPAVRQVQDCPAPPRPDFTLLLATPMTPLATYTLRIEAVADTVGNLMPAVERTFTFPGDPEPADPGDLIINEVLYAPAQPGLEFVELYNRSAHALDLREIHWHDARSEPQPLAERVFLIGPGAYVVLAEDTAALRKIFGNVPVLLQPGAWPPLNNDGDVVVLKRSDSLRLDSLRYDASMGQPGRSLERRDPDLPTWLRANWAVSVDSLGATPGRRNSRYEPDLAPPVVRFVAVRDSFTVVVFFDEVLDPSSVQPEAFELDDGTQPAAATWVSDAQQVLLHFERPLTQQQLVIHDLRDLKGNQLASAVRPLAYPPVPDALRINEILYAPLADPHDGRPDQPEYIELINISERHLNLEGLFWTDVPDEHNRADTMWLPVRFRALAPESLAVVFNVPAGQDPLAFIEAAFPGATRQPGTVWIPLSGASLGLRNEGDLIHLQYGHHTIDSVYYDPSWHQAGVREATGLSLERLLPEGPSNDPANWTSSPDPSGGTPGRPNAARLQTTPPLPEQPDLEVTPSPFSPDGDGIDDVAVIRFKLPTAGALVRARIFDSQGRPVRTLGPANSGAQGLLFWDGRDDTGGVLPIGIYIVLLEAMDARGGRLLARRAPVVLARPLR
ncbi:lamin tail domain-containing protein [Rhodothermus marinus]|uniref:lamin tail domain-containing protein n=1 Tax=Rhodothermus marinus TaxID=29549 RepID=UPI0012BA3C7B|nr:lamin tail domain-containing protein [Rhodothermus marinus]BBM72634.1 hypothetical protein RmaAA338_14990 [Rhodothermus marinus]